MKFAFFDAKPYDISSFENISKEKGVEFKFFETKLNEDTMELAHGFDGVCVFVNDTVTAKVIDYFYENGIKMIEELSEVCDKLKVAGTFAPHSEI